LDGLRLGAVTDSAGRFTIPDVKPGTYTVVASRVGYLPTRAKVTISRLNEDMVMTIMPADVVKEDVIVSANRRVQAVQDVPISVSTVSAQDLSQRNITQLDDALRYVSGVNVVKDQVNVRGTSGFALGVGNRTMVLLDGFPLMSGDNGDIKFDVMPVADVGRIEIVKGAGSALYGTGALGGVVTMFTRPIVKEQEFSARAYLGSYTEPRFDEWKFRGNIPITGGMDLRLARKWDHFTLSGSAGIRTDQSYRNFDEQARGFAFAKGQWLPDDRNRVTVFGLYALQISQNFIYWKDLQNATQPPDDQDPDQLLRSDKLAGAVEWQSLLDNRTSLVVRTGLYRTHYENTLNSVAQDSNTSTAYAWNSDVLLTSTLVPEFTITGGISARINNVSADVYGEQLQTIAALFAQGEYVFINGPTFTLGLRLDHEKTVTVPEHLELSPKFGMSWPLSSEFTLRASVGRGFRAPSIAERYANIRYGPFRVKANPDLLAESSWSAEVGFHWTAAALAIPLDLDLAVFDNELFDLIEPNFDTSDPSVPIVFRNITRARIVGSELNIRAALHRTLMAETGLTAMLPRDLNLDQTLKYRNNILWYSRAIFTPLEPLTIQLEYRFQNRVERIDDRLVLFVPDADARVPAHVVDARVMYTIPVDAHSLRLGVLCRNLLDYYYAEAVANLSPTRSILLQLEVQ
jgi:iron complex outermembrane receptor protein